MEKNRIGAEYLSRLQGIYKQIENKGILVSIPKLEKTRVEIERQINDNFKIISQIWGCHVYVGAANDDGSDDSVNLNSSSGKRTPLKKLQSLGYEIPKLSSRNEDGEYVSKESLAELSIQKMLSKNQFNHSTGDPVLISILKIRELATLRNRYVNANLYVTSSGEHIFLSSYNCAGTTTGRRSSKKHVFNYGNNAQNFPKHGELAYLYRQCLVARPGKILLSVDQIQAEDWPVSALAQNTSALRELQENVDRHRKLACEIFELPWDYYTDKEWKESIQRYLGKKTRHANNYGMQGPTMSDSLAKEGKSYSVQACDAILKKVNQIDPSIQGVFHEYIKSCLYKDRTLITPFGRERQFFGLRSGDNSSNNKIFREAFSYIPQSTVGDNTGFAIFELNRFSTTGILPFACIQEGHDSIVQEIDEKPEIIWEYIQRTADAFDRLIRFEHSGIEFKIPVEGELGFNFKDTETMSSKQHKSKRLIDLSYQDMLDCLHKVQEAREKEQANASEEAETKLDFVI